MWYTYLAYIMRGPRAVSYSEKSNNYTQVPGMDAGHATKPQIRLVVITRSSYVDVVGDLRRSHELRGALVQ